MATAAKKKPAKARPKRPPKAKQQYLPGLEPPSIPAIDRLAEKYVEVRNSRMEMTKEEVKNADLLEAKMKEHGLTKYEFDGKVVELQHTEKVKVRRKEPVEFVRERAEQNGDGNE
jgi:hypothetical protein